MVGWHDGIFPQENQNGIAVAGVAAHVEGDEFRAFGKRILHGYDGNDKFLLTCRDKQVGRDRLVVYTVGGGAEDLVVNWKVGIGGQRQPEGDGAVGTAFGDGAVEAGRSERGAQSAGTETFCFEEYAGVIGRVAYVGDDEFDGVRLAGYHDGFGGEYAGQTVESRLVG